MLPHHSTWLVEAYSDAVTPEYGYMVIDNKPKTLETHRFQTGILVTKRQLFTRRKNSWSKFLYICMYCVKINNP